MTTEQKIQHLEELLQQAVEGLTAIALLPGEDLPEEETYRLAATLAEHTLDKVAPNREEYMLDMGADLLQRLQQEETLQTGGEEPSS